MINVLRADIYRLTRGKTLYILLAAVVILAALNVLPAYGQGIFGDASWLWVPADPTDPYSPNVPVLWLTGDLSLAYMLMNAKYFSYVLIPVVIVVAVTMFSSGAVKNSLAWGASRTKLYLSAWIISSVTCVALFLVYLGSGVAMATIAHGPGTWALVTADPNPGLNLAISQLTMLLAIASVGVLLSFAIRLPLAAIGTYGLFMVLPMVVSIARSFASVPGVSQFVTLAFPSPDAEVVVSPTCMPVMDYPWMSSWEFIIPTVYLSSTPPPDLAGMTPTDPELIPYIDGVSPLVFDFYPGITPPCTDLLPALAVGLPWIAVPALIGIFLFSRAQIR